MGTNAEITFLGTGTSIGVPVIGCDCPVCTSDDPKNKRLRSSIYVKTDEVAFIVDTGPDFRQQCLRENIRHLDAVLLTHAHSDHIMGFDDLRRFTVMEEEAIDVYAIDSCLKRLKAAFHYAFDGKNRFRGYLKPNVCVIDGPFRVGDVAVTPIEVMHGNVETIGFLFTFEGGKTVAYLPDVKELGEPAMELLQGVDVLIIDALQQDTHWTHLSIPETLEIARRLQPGETWLTHLSCRVDYKQAEPDFPEGVRIAWDGLKLKV